MIPPEDESGWEALRRALWRSERLNLNPGTLGTPSRRVTDAMAAFAEPVEGWPLGAHTSGREAMRAARAAITGVWPHPTPALGLGTTAQMSALLPAILAALGPLTLVTTTEEHEGAIAGWARHPSVQLVIVAPDALIDAIARHRPELVLVSHVNWTEGRVADVDAVLQAAPGWVIVDVAQSLGVLDVPLRGDIVIGSLHKWVAGPAGSGVTFLSERARAALVATSWAGHAVDTEAPAADFEPAGTQDFSRWAGVTAAVELYAALGAARTRARVFALGTMLAEGLPSALPRVSLRFFDGATWSEHPTVAPGGVVVAHFGAADPYPLYRQLEARGVHVKCIKGAGRNQLRFGVHWSETRSRLEQALARIAEAGRAA